ncbi:MAG: hypothetical protein ACLU9S_20840 [Oscillospiraceae bacterium]
MNFFDAKLVKDGDKYVVTVGGIKVELSGREAGGLCRQKCRRLG